MEPTTEIQATEDLTLSGDYAAASADSLVVDNANDNAGQEEGFEIVLKDDETAPKQDPQRTQNSPAAASSANDSASLSSRWRQLNAENCRRVYG